MAVGLAKDGAEKEQEEASLNDALDLILSDQVSSRKNQVSRSH
jgi:hypothetical protein